MSVASLNFRMLCRTDSLNTTERISAKRKPNLVNIGMPDETKVKVLQQSIILPCGNVLEVKNWENFSSRVRKWIISTRYGS